MHIPPGFTTVFPYVVATDAKTVRAVAAGGTQRGAVADMPYGGRQGGVADASCNIWWLSQRLVAGAY